MLLCRGNLRFGQRQLQIHAIGGECFVDDHAVQLGDAQFDQGKLTEAARAIERYTADQGQFFGALQALVRATAISPGQASGAQLNTAVPADNQDRDLIAILRVMAESIGRPAVPPGSPSSLLRY